MLYRKIIPVLEKYFSSNSDRIMMVDGARQIGKSYIIRHVGNRMFPNFIEINMEEDKLGDRLFSNVKTTEDFYLALSTVAGNKMRSKEDTLIFIDEIQAYENLFTLIKFLIRDNKFTYIASGSLLGITLKNTQSVPVGSMEIVHMYPMDFEEFIMANGVGELALKEMEKHFLSQESLSEEMHEKIMDLFKKYLIVGGLPKAVATYIETRNVAEIRTVQRDVHKLYEVDCLKYEEEHNKKLKILRLYEMVPSILENKKKRVVVTEIENKSWKRTRDYIEEFDYLISAGVVLEVKAVSTPTYPLIQNSSKNLMKLYMNDVGLLSGIYYHNNIRAILENENSPNLGTIYETVVAQELKAHGFNLFYYDNKKKGEVDFLISDPELLTNIPIEIKSGKDYLIHSALSSFVNNTEYHIDRGIVFSNTREVSIKDKILYMPIYYLMFLNNFKSGKEEDLFL